MSDQAERVLRTGGPLKVWKREVERAGGDYITPVVDILGVEDMGIAAGKMIDKLGEQFQSWNPIQYIKGFPPEEQPKFIIMPFFRGGDLEIEASCEVSAHWKEGGACHREDRQVVQYRWSPSTGIRYIEVGVLEYQAALIARTMGRVGAKLSMRYQEEEGEDLALTMCIHPQHLWWGSFPKKDVFEYEKVQAWMRRIIAGEDDGQ